VSSNSPGDAGSVRTNRKGQSPIRLTPLKPQAHVRENQSRLIMPLSRHCLRAPGSAESGGDIAQPRCWPARGRQYRRFTDEPWGAHCPCGGCKMRLDAMLYMQHIICREEE